jgi:hypothetical protein
VRFRPPARTECAARVPSSRCSGSLVRLGHFDEVDRTACSPRRCRAGMERLSSRFPPSVVLDAPKPPLGGPGVPVRRRFPGAWGCASLRPVDAGRRPLTRCRVRRFFCLHVPKIAPSSLPNHRVHSRCGLLRRFGRRLRRRPRVPTLWFHATSPVCSSMALSALFQRLTTLGFIVVSRGVRGHRDSRDAFLPFEAFPPPMAVVRWSLRRRLATRALHAGRLSPPARLSPGSAAPLAGCLEACRSDHPEGPSNRHPLRSRAAEVHQPPYRLAVRSYLDGASGMTATSRFFSIVGSVARAPFPAFRARCSRGLGLLVAHRLAQVVQGVSTSKKTLSGPPFGSRLD